MTKINLVDYGEQTHYVSNFIGDAKEVYFYAGREGSVEFMHVICTALGQYNLSAKIGDTCRLMMKSAFGYPSDDPKDIEYHYQGIYIWDGVVTKRILQQSNIRIGGPVSKVLIEKVNKKPELV